MRARLSLIALVALLACASLASLSEAAHRHGSPHSLYRGKTAQKYRIYAVSSPGRITLLRFKAKMLCRDGSYLFGVASDFEATPMRKRRALHRHPVRQDRRRLLEGTPRQGQAHGHPAGQRPAPSGVRCDSGPVRFVAR